MSDALALALGTHTPRSKAAASGGGPIVTDNLVLYLDAGDTDSYGGSGTTWSDLSDTGQDFDLVNGPVFDATEGGGSFAFDGTNDYSVASADEAQFNTTDGSIEFWIQFDAIPTTGGQEIRFNNCHWTNNKPMLNNLIYYSDTKLRWTCEMAGVDLIHSTHPDGTGTYTPSISWVNGVWYHLVATHDSSGTSKLYRDGVEVGTLAGTVTGVLTSAAIKPAVMVGKYLSNYTNGSLAIHRIYKDKALSAAEVEQNYDAQKSRFGH